MTEATKRTDERYWIALNGASCALTSLPLRNPLVTPTPQQLLGFPTLKEAKRAQRICLQSSMNEVQRFFTSLSPDVRAGRVRVINPEQPQLPTRCPTMWTEDGDLFAVLHAGQELATD
jgi:hypothetical protein